MKAIQGYEGMYEITEDGRVYSHHIKRFRKAHIQNSGYFLIWLYKDNVDKAFLVHRLVAIAYVSNPDNKEFVNHIDGNKLNNCKSNLEWVTKSENALHAIATGLRVYPESVITNDIILDTISRVKSGESLTSISSSYALGLTTLSVKLKDYLEEHELEALDKYFLQRKAKVQQEVQIKYPVDMCDKTTGQVIKSFVSLSEAGRYLDCSSGNISNVLSGRAKTAAGFYWQRTEAPTTSPKGSTG